LHGKQLRGNASSNITSNASSWTMNMNMNMNFKLEMSIILYIEREFQRKNLNQPFLIIVEVEGGMPLNKQSGLIPKG